jgi:hypothetical protein
VTLFVGNGAFADVQEEEFYFIVGAIDATDADNPKLIARSEPVKVKVTSR